MKPSQGKRTIYITEFDLERLNKLIQGADPQGRDKRHLQDLAEELKRGKVLSQTKVPNNVITMNSKVRLKDLDTGEEVIYTLVFPPDADIQHQKISILAPVGTALIGYRAGDIIEWNVPSGLKRLKVEEILYQPEAAGDYDL